MFATHQATAYNEGTKIGEEERGLKVKINSYEEQKEGYLRDMEKIEKARKEKRLVEFTIVSILENGNQQAKRLAH